MKPNEILIIRTDGTEERETFDGPPGKLLDFITGKIGCVYADVVNLRDGRVMMVDDMGAISDPPLPVNEKATELYHSVCVPGTTWPIRGDAVVTLDSNFAGLGDV